MAGGGVGKAMQAGYLPSLLEAASKQRSNCPQYLRNQVLLPCRCSHGSGRAKCRRNVFQLLRRTKFAPVQRGEKETREQKQHSLKNQKVEHHQVPSTDFQGLSSLRAGGLNGVQSLGPSCLQTKLWKHEFPDFSSLGWSQAGHERLLVSQVPSTS